MNILDRIFKFQNIFYILLIYSPYQLKQTPKGQKAPWNVMESSPHLWRRMNLKKLKKIK